LKIPKGYSESVNRRRIDNTMANKKRTKGQATIYVTRVTRQVPLEEQELLTLPEHLGSPQFLVGFALLDI
jgi:hypothetical protein